MGDPPLNPGADQETSDEVLDLEVAETDVGCCGTVEGGNTKTELAPEFAT